jgi:iron complex transport system ATP-binding protein
MLRAAGVSFSYGRARKARAAARSTADGPAPIPFRSEDGLHQRAVRNDAVLNDVCVNVERGELVGILGPNGSGKTTLLKLLGGMHRPTIGSVTLDGRPLTEWSHREVARRIAFVPQETQAPFDFSVLDIVLMGRFPHLGAFALEGPEDLAIARRALAATGTGQFEGRAFSTLSGGEKQRVVIAGALAQSTQLLLLDEPTASLDIGHQIEVQMLLQELNAGQGVTMLLSTHDLNLAAALCRRLVLLKDGQVLASGPTEEVLTPAAVQALYGVEADIARHPATGHLTVVPIRRG